MTRIIKTFCDLCEKECDQVRFGVVSGCVAKMSEKGEMQNMIFEVHYCEDDIGKIIGFIEKLKNESTETDKPIDECYEEGGHCIVH